MRTAMLLGVGALPSSSGAEGRRSAAMPAQFRSAAAPAARLRMARPVRSAASVTVEAVTTIEKKGADIWNKSYYPKGEDMVATEKAWVVIDAKGQRLGRMATLIAGYLRGANTPSYHPSCDTGAFVVVINAELVEVTGKKAEQKTYHRSFNGRPGSHKVETFEHLQARLPQRIIEEAVWGMITKERLGRRLFTHLKVYKGPNHPHEAQKPVDVTALIARNMPPETKK